MKNFVRLKINNYFGIILLCFFGIDCAATCSPAAEKALEEFKDCTTRHGKNRKQTAQERADAFERKLDENGATTAQDNELQRLILEAKIDSTRIIDNCETQAKSLADNGGSESTKCQEDIVDAGDKVQKDLKTNDKQRRRTKKASKQAKESFKQLRPSTENLIPTTTQVQNPSPAPTQQNFNNPPPQQNFRTIGGTNNPSPSFGNISEFFRQQQAQQQANRREANSLRDRFGVDEDLFPEQSPDFNLDGPRGGRPGSSLAGGGVGGNEAIGEGERVRLPGDGDLDSVTAKRERALRKLLEKKQQRTIASLGPGKVYQSQNGALPMPPARPSGQQIMRRFAMHESTIDSTSEDDIPVEVIGSEEAAQKKAIDEANRLPDIKIHEDEGGGGSAKRKKKKSGFFALMKQKLGSIFSSEDEEEGDNDEERDEIESKIARAGADKKNDKKNENSERDVVTTEENEKEEPGIFERMGDWASETLSSAKWFGTDEENLEDIDDEVAEKVTENDPLLGKQFEEDEVSIPEDVRVLGGELDMSQKSIFELVRDAHSRANVVVPDLDSGEIEPPVLVNSDIYGF